MVVDDIASLIATDGFGTLSVDLFRGDLPPSPDGVAAVNEYPGGAAVTFFGTRSINERPRVQILVRGVAYDSQTPRLRIERIYQALMDRGAFTVNSTRYMALEPVQPPFPMGKDDNKRWVYAVNFAVTKERTTLST